MPRSLIAVGLMCPLLLVGCEDDPTGWVGCTETVDVAVSFDAQGPIFDWTPACAVAQLIVDEPDGLPFRSHWFIQTAQGNGIWPPISYGITPPNTRLSDGPEPLTPGDPYVLVLTIRTKERGAGGANLIFKVFFPFVMPEGAVGG